MRVMWEILFHNQRISHKKKKEKSFSKNKNKNRR